MPDYHRPATGLRRHRPRAVAAAGCALAAALAAAGAFGLLPPLGLSPAAAGSARGGGRTRAERSVGAEEAPERAKRSMLAAERWLHAARERAGVRAEGEAAGDASGLIGGEVTPLMTTLGSLEAKRLSTDPEWARVLAIRLAGAGIGRGDLVAAGFSGSFPGLNLASMAACESLGARLIAVSSVTASTWGANQPGFTWPEMEWRLARAGLVRQATVAVTAGGDGDQALDLDPDGRRLACDIRDRAAAALGVRALSPANFEEAVGQRLAAYQDAAAGRPIALYINVGGTEASLGRSSAVLRRRSGFLPPVAFGRPSEQGVVARLAAAHVPTLMLLNVRDLALRWGVPLGGRGGGR